MNYQEIETYGDLLDYLKRLRPDQLKERVQVMGRSQEPIRLMGVVAIGQFTADCESRSSVDGNHRPESIVILADAHPFGDHGEAYDTLTEDGQVPTYLEGHPDAPKEL